VVCADAEPIVPKWAAAMVTATVPKKPAALMVDFFGHFIFLHYSLSVPLVCCSLAGHELLPSFLFISIILFLVTIQTRSSTDHPRNSNAILQ
jgi:hypothetical protein